MASLEEPVYLYLVGTAGSGKSRFTDAFGKYLVSAGVDVVSVNLDPGAEFLPYAPEVDIRDWISLQDVMADYNLGPNGAQVMAADLLAIKSGEIKEVLDTFRTDVVLVDTPGQTELFVFRESGRIVMDVFSKDRSLIGFLVDPFLAKRPSAFVSQLLLAATTQFRFQAPLLNILTKADLAGASDVARLVEWGASPDALQDALLSAERPDLFHQMNLDVARILESMGSLTSLIPTSAEQGTGMEDVYTRIQEVFGASEDVTHGIAEEEEQ